MTSQPKFAHGDIVFAKSGSTYIIDNPHPDPGGNVTANRRLEDGGRGNFVLVVPEFLELVMPHPLPDRHVNIYAESHGKTRDTLAETTYAVLRGEPCLGVLSLVDGEPHWTPA